MTIQDLIQAAQKEALAAEAKLARIARTRRPTQEESEKALKAYAKVLEAQRSLK